MELVPGAKIDGRPMRGVLLSSATWYQIGGDSVCLCDKNEHHQSHTVPAAELFDSRQRFC